MTNIIKLFKRYFHLFEYMTDEQFIEFDYMPDLEIDKDRNLVEDLITMSITPDNIYNILKLADVYQFKKINDLLKKICCNEDVDIYDLDLHIFCFILNLLNTYNLKLLSKVIEQTQHKFFDGTLNYKSFGTFDDMIFGYNPKTCLYKRIPCPNNDVCSACYNYKITNKKADRYDNQYIHNAFLNDDIDLLKCITKNKYCIPILHDNIILGYKISYELFKYIIDITDYGHVRYSSDNTKIATSIIKNYDVEYLQYFIAKFNIKLHIICLIAATFYNKFEHVKCILSNIKCTSYANKCSNQISKDIHYYMHNIEYFNIHTNKYSTILKTDFIQYQGSCIERRNKNHFRICYHDGPIGRLQYMYLMIGIIINHNSLNTLNYLLENIKLLKIKDYVYKMHIKCILEKNTNVKITSINTNDKKTSINIGAKKTPSKTSKK
jgi:hypothetical protein